MFRSRLRSLISAAVATETGSNFNFRNSTLSIILKTLKTRIVIENITLEPQITSRTRRVLEKHELVQGGIVRCCSELLTCMCDCEDDAGGGDCRRGFVSLFVSVPLGIGIVFGVGGCAFDGGVGC